jgi:hypothetical protein
VEGPRHHLNENVSVVLGNGDGTLQAAVNYAGGAGATGVASGDVNGDGYPDLVITTEYECKTCSDGGVNVLRGTGSGTFLGAERFSAGGNGGGAASPVIADLNGDGHPDVVVVTGLSSDGTGYSGVSVLLNNSRY